MAGAKDSRPSASLESSPWTQLSPGLGSQFRKPLSGEVALQLIKLLDECANHIAANSMQSANICFEHISHFASADGDAIQRITAYFIEAFANKCLKTYLKLSSQPEGPPHLKITAIHENKEVLEQMDHQLTEKANNLNIPFQFNPIVSKLENLDLESLHIKTGEVLAISSVLQLHSLWATDEGMVRNSPVASKNRPKVLHINQRPL
uniref:Uncharacterized protein n=1 Tax=Quercus lobata TaxID=97700 RepID=A0A7N2LC05_QUELO